jgi:ring-1,2-phenylacetyl-CoA epoxidase subunit PaaB
MALTNARDVYSRRKEAVNIWVVPSECITASTPEDMGPFFDPANDKVYRNPNFYKTPEGIKMIS